MKITEGDRRFIESVLLPKFKVKKLGIKYDPNTKKWPDIWIELGRVPVITVTDEWARQNMHERRKRLVHEFLHLSGMEHDESIEYSTIPSRDKYSMGVYRKLVER